MEPSPRPSIAPVPRPAGRTRTRAEFRWLAVGVGCTDLVAILAAFIAAYVIRFGFVAGGYDFLGVMIVAPPLWLVVFGMFRLYSLARLAPAEEAKRLVSATAIGITGVVTVSYWSAAELSRQWVATSWLLALLLLLVGRRIWRYVVARSRERGMFTFHTLILGTNAEAAHLAAVMRAGGPGFDAIGFVRAGTGDQRVSAVAGSHVPVLGDLRDIVAIIERTGADCVYVASSAIGSQDMRSVTKLTRSEGVEVRVSANIPEMLSSRLAAQPLGGLMGFSVWPVRLSGVQSVAKRTSDILAAVLGAVLLLPFFALIALAIKGASRGPVLYRQTRVGRGGRTFTMLKFRTMRLGADQDRGPVSNDVASPLFKARDDPRVTRVGRFLRRWSLDELPQLANVIRGDMSLVGPRPSMPDEVERYQDWHMDRFEVRPGITGLWQVSGRSELSFDDYVRLDLFYIENWSLALDCYVLAKTIPAVLGGRGAY